MKTNDLIEERIKELEFIANQKNTLLSLDMRTGYYSLLPEIKGILFRLGTEIAEAAREESYQSFIDNLGYVLTESGQLRGNMQRLVNDYELILDKLKQPEKS